MRKVRLWGLKWLSWRSKVRIGLPGTVMSTTPHCPGPRPVGMVWEMGKIVMKRGHFVWIINLLWVWGSPHSHRRFGACQAFTRAGLYQFHPKDSKKREKSHSAGHSFSFSYSKPSPMLPGGSLHQKGPGKGVSGQWMKQHFKQDFQSLSQWDWDPQALGGQQQEFGIINAIQDPSWKTPSRQKLTGFLPFNRRDAHDQELWLSQANGLGIPGFKCWSAYHLLSEQF